MVTSGAVIIRRRTAEHAFGKVCRSPGSGSPRSDDDERPEWFQVIKYVRHDIMAEDLTTPSYRYKLAEAKRLRQVAAAAAQAQGINWVRNRLEAYTFAESLGVRHPTVLARFEHIADVEFDTLGEGFTLKPIAGSGARGVFVLQRRGDRYLDLMRHVTWSPMEIVARYVDQTLTYRISSTVLAEETVLPDDDTQGGTPDKWRLHCFSGTARLIMRRSRQPSQARPRWKYHFWYRDWTPVDIVHEAINTHLSRATHADAMIAAADKLAAAANSPYAVFDFFDVPSGVFMNDVITLPDHLPVYDHALDRLMGEWWEAAHAETTTLGATK